MAVDMQDGKNAQNVHIVSLYKQALSEKLGLFTSSSSFKETIPVRNDNFERNEDLVEAMFYFKVSPNYLAEEFLKYVENRDDVDLKEKIDAIEEEIGRKRSPKSSSGDQLATFRASLEREKSKSTADQDPDKIQRLETQIATMERNNSTKAPETTTDSGRSIEDLQNDLKKHKTTLKENQRFRVISTGEILGYLSNQYKFHDLDEFEEAVIYFSYFSDNPVTNPKAILTKAGAIRLLKGFGFIIDETKSWEQEKTHFKKLSKTFEERKKRQEEEKLITTFKNLNETIQAEYAEFKEQNPDKVKNVSTATLFFQSLATQLKDATEAMKADPDSAEEYSDSALEIAEKMTAILTRGAGVGGLEKRSATPEERVIMKDALNLIAERIPTDDLRLCITYEKYLDNPDPQILKHEQAIFALSNLAKLKARQSEAEATEWEKAPLEEKTALLISTYPINSGTLEISYEELMNRRLAN